MIHAINPSIHKQRLMDLCEFDTNLVYIVSSLELCQKERERKKNSYGTIYVFIHVR